MPLPHSARTMVWCRMDAPEGGARVVDGVQAMILLGHRGARFEAPENTLPGFRYAIDLGLEAVEFDLRLTRDGEVVVIHDETVDRTTNGTGAVADLTLGEVQRLDARSIFPDWPESC